MKKLLSTKINLDLNSMKDVSLNEGLKLRNIVLQGQVRNVGALKMLNNDNFISSHNL